MPLRRSARIAAVTKKAELVTETAARTGKKRGKVRQEAAMATKAGKRGC